MPYQPYLSRLQLLRLVKTSKMMSQFVQHALSYSYLFYDRKKTFSRCAIIHPFARNTRSTLISQSTPTLCWYQRIVRWSAKRFFTVITPPTSSIPSTTFTSTKTVTPCWSRIIRSISHHLIVKFCVTHMYHCSSYQSRTIFSQAYPLCLRIYQSVSIKTHNTKIKIHSIYSRNLITTTKYHTLIYQKYTPFPLHKQPQAVLYRHIFVLILSISQCHYMC